MNAACEAASVSWPDAAAIVGFAFAMAWVLVTLIRRVKR